MNEAEKVKYIQPTSLCDFDKTPEIRGLAEDLTTGLSDDRQKTGCIFDFVKNINYRFDDWDVPASGTLEKRSGMCSGKTNLFVAMLRSLDIPARYVILRCRAELKLYETMVSTNNELPGILGEPYQEGDHVYAAVYHECWTQYDPGRDPALEQGFTRLGIPVDMQPANEHGECRTIMSVFDEWAAARQNRVRFPDTRQYVLRLMNEQLDIIRSGK